MPFLSVAAEALLSALKAIAQAEENAHLFHELGQRSTQILLTIAAELEGVEMDERLEANMMELERCGQRHCKVLKGFLEY